MFWPPTLWDGWITLSSRLSMERARFAGAKTALRVCAMVFDTARGLGALPTPQLVRSTVLLHACASRAVVLAGCALLRAAVQRPDGLGRPALLAARHTFFRQFVAGERLADVQTVAAQLSASGVRCIVDHSTEELEHTEVRRDLSPDAATAAQPEPDPKPEPEPEPEPELEPGAARQPLHEAQAPR